MKFPGTPPPWHISVDICNGSEKSLKSVFSHFSFKIHILCYKLKWKLWNGKFLGNPSPPQWHGYSGGWETPKVIFCLKIHIFRLQIGVKIAESKIAKFFSLCHKIWCILMRVEHPNIPELAFTFLALQFIIELEWK